MTVTPDTNDAGATPATPAPAVPTTPAQAPPATPAQAPTASVQKLQAELAKAQADLAKLAPLKDQVESLLSSGQFGETDLQNFQEAAAATLDQLRTDAERLSLTNKDQAKKLEAATAEATQYRTRYETTLTDNAISAEAGPRAVSSATAKLIATILRPNAKVDLATGQVTFAVTDAEGKTSQVTAKQAVEALEADVTNYGSLFKSGVSGGAGTLVDGVTKTQTGAIDFTNLTFEKYSELMAKDPNAVYKSLGVK
jgi:hypothetical protein